MCIYIYIQSMSPYYLICIYMYPYVSINCNQIAWLRESVQHPQFLSHGTPIKFAVWGVFVIFKHAHISYNLILMI